MGRKTKDTVEYFPFVIKDGKTLFVLQRKYGLSGIGFFTQVMRMLGQTPGHYYVYVDEYDKDRFNTFCGLSESDVRAMLSDMAKTGKIDGWLWSHRGVVYSQAFVDELEELYRKRKTEIPTRDFVIEETQYLEKVKTPADSGGFPESADFREHSIGEESIVEDSNMSAEALVSNDADEVVFRPPAAPQSATPKTPKPMPPLRDPTARWWEEALTKIQPPDTWDNFGKQRAALNTLAKRTMNLVDQSPYETVGTLIDAVIGEYRRLITEAKPSDTYWSRASYTPTDLITRWPQVWTSLAARYELQAKQREYENTMSEVQF